jgi:DNA-binding response OmpR family regulator
MTDLFRFTQTGDMGEKILIIDDERDLCELIEMALIREHFSVDCAFTLGQAGEKLQSRPDIILLDQNLPDGLGLDYLHTHREDFDDARVIMISSNMNSNLQLEAKREGVLVFLQKPFTVRDIREAIRSVA